MNFCGLFFFSLVPISVKYIVKQLKPDFSEDVGFGIHPSVQLPSFPTTPTWILASRVGDLLLSLALKWLVPLVRLVCPVLCLEPEPCPS